MTSLPQTKELDNLPEWKRQEIEAGVNTSAAFGEADAGDALARFEATAPVSWQPPEPIQVPWPEPMGEAAFYGLPGDIVRMIEPHSEADPVALLANTLAAAGSVIGPRPHFLVEADKHRFRLFVALVGETSKARKGTSWGHIRRLFTAVDSTWEPRVMDGLSSGEGLIYHVRDGIEKNGEILDEGVTDKRLLVMEAEFARVLRTLAREGNTLSAVTRNAWDSGDLRTLTKNSPAVATGAHISIIGHITIEELLRYLSSTEAANGFGNRFIWLCVRRSKSLPFGGSMEDTDPRPILDRLRQAVDFARQVDRVRWAEETRSRWVEVYEELSEGRPGMVGALIARAESQVTRLAGIYALMDCSAEIRPVHLEAALAFWRYAEQSGRHIFQGTTGNSLADKLNQALIYSPDGLTRTQISRDILHGNPKSDEISEALDLLRALGKARCEKRPPEPPGKKPVEVWFANAQPRI